MANKVITKKAKEKLAAARVTGKIAKISHMALGTGGTGEGGAVLPVDESHTALNQEIVRKEVRVRKKTDTSYEYSIQLAADELLGASISELAVIDEDGDLVAICHFLSKGKDDTEVTYKYEDAF